MEQPASTTLVSLTNVLNDLASSDIEDRAEDAINLFYWLYKAVRDGTQMTEDEKRRAGEALGPFLIDLEECVYNEVACMPGGPLWTSCMIRSGLQYLLDEFGPHLPNLEAFLVQVNLDEFDRRLACYDPSSYTGVNKKHMETNKMPDHHKWWWGRQDPTKLNCTDVQ